MKGFEYVTVVLADEAHVALADSFFALDVTVVTDVAPGQPAAPCTTNDGCASTCASSCVSGGV